MEVNPLLSMPAHALKQHNVIGNDGLTLLYQCMSAPDGQFQKMYFKPRCKSFIYMKNGKMLVSMSTAE